MLGDNSLPMKIISVTGSAPSWTISWTCAALGSWLRGRGVRALPFRGLTRSKNPLMTLDGGEVSRALAVQCEACGAHPRASNNPLVETIPDSGPPTILFLGEVWNASGAETPDLFAGLESALTEVGAACEVVIADGGGQPCPSAPSAAVRFARELVGRAWLTLFLEEAHGESDGKGAKDRAEGQASATVAVYSSQAGGARVRLGELRIDRGAEGSEEDEAPPFPLARGRGGLVAWVRLPTCAVLNEWQPWLDDTGVASGWIQKPSEAVDARAIVLPGCLDTMADLRWLRSSGIEDSLLAAFRRGVPIVGICGGYQMLGESLSDREGVAGAQGQELGLGLLPVVTEFLNPRIERRTLSHKGGRIWPTYEIHRGRTAPTRSCEHPNELVESDGRLLPEGAKRAYAWGTYQHGWFEAPETRQMLARAAGLTGHKTPRSTWQELRSERYAEMALHLEARLELKGLAAHLEKSEAGRGSRVPTTAGGL